MPSAKAKQLSDKQCYNAKRENVCSSHKQYYGEKKLKSARKLQNKLIGKVQRRKTEASRKAYADQPEKFKQAFKEAYADNTEKFNKETFQILYAKKC